MPDLLTYGKYLALHPPTLAWSKAAPVAYSDCAAKGSEMLDYRAGTICDLIAMCMMMVGAGVDRIEALKKPINQGISLDTGEGDRAQIFYPPKKVKGHAEKFKTLLDTWAQLPGNGVVQFKFEPESGAHTFMVERFYVSQTAKPSFRIYQCYQGGYRLLDFLLGDQDTDKGLQTIQDSINEEEIDQEITRSASSIYNKVPPSVKQLSSMKNSMSQKSLKVVKTGIEQLVDTRTEIGLGLGLSRASFMTYVIGTLASSLTAGGADAQQYATLTGHLVGNRQCAENLIVLMCDTVNPGTFEQNYDYLLNPDNRLTGFCGLPLKV